MPKVAHTSHHLPLKSPLANGKYIMYYENRKTVFDIHYIDEIFIESLVFTLMKKPTQYPVQSIFSGAEKAKKKKKKKELIKRAAETSLQPRELNENLPFSANMNKKIMHAAILDIPRDPTIKHFEPSRLVPSLVCPNLIPGLVFIVPTMLEKIN